MRGEERGEACRLCVNRPNLSKGGWNLQLYPLTNHHLLSTLTCSPDPPAVDIGVLPGLKALMLQKAAAAVQCTRGNREKCRIMP